MLSVHKNRRACDRCHRQKLCCKRETSSGPCIRCARAKTICRITPRQKKAKRLSMSISTIPKMGLPDCPPQILQLGPTFLNPIHEPRSRSNSNSSEDEPSYDKECQNYCEAKIEISAIMDFSASNFTFRGAPDASRGGFGQETVIGLRGSDLGRVSPFSLDDFIGSPGCSSPLDVQFSKLREPRDLDLDFINPVSLDLSASPIDLRHELPPIQMASPLSDCSFLYETHSPSSGNQQICARQKPSGTAGIQLLVSHGWMNAVMELNAKLYNLEKTGFHIRKSFDHQTNNYESVFDSTKSQIADVDQAFILSQQLLEAFFEARISGLADCKSREQETKVKPEQYETNLSPVGATYHESEPRKHDLSTAQDSGPLLLLLSCRERLLRIYQNLLLRIQQWNQNMHSPGGESIACMPGLNIGQFSLKLFPNLQVVFILQLIEYFVERLQGETHTMESSIRGSPQHLNSQFMVGASEEVLAAIKNSEMKTLYLMQRIKRMV